MQLVYVILYNELVVETTSGFRQNQSLLNPQPAHSPLSSGQGMAEAYCS